MFHAECQRLTLVIPLVNVPVHVTITNENTFRCIPLCAPAATDSSEAQPWSTTAHSAVTEDVERITCMYELVGSEQAMESGALGPQLDVVSLLGIEIASDTSNILWFQFESPEIRSEFQQALTDVWPVRLDTMSLDNILLAMSHARRNSDVDVLASISSMSPSMGSPDVSHSKSNSTHVATTTNSSHGRLPPAAHSAAGDLTEPFPRESTSVPSGARPPNSFGLSVDAIEVHSVLSSSPDPAPPSEYDGSNVAEVNTNNNNGDYQHHHQPASTSACEGDGVHYYHDLEICVCPVVYLCIRESEERRRLERGLLLQFNSCVMEVLWQVQCELRESRVVLPGSSAGSGAPSPTSAVTKFVEPVHSDAAFLISEAEEHVRQALCRTHKEADGRAARTLKLEQERWEKILRNREAELARAFSSQMDKHNRDIYLLQRELADIKAKWKKELDISKALSLELQESRQHSQTVLSQSRAREGDLHAQIYTLSKELGKLGAGSPIGGALSDSPRSGVMQRTASRLFSPRPSGMSPKSQQPSQPQNCDRKLSLFGSFFGKKD